MIACLLPYGRIYCSTLYFRWEHGEAAAKTEIELELRMPYRLAGLTGGDAAVDSPVSAFKSAEQYKAIVYGKGALFFGELEKLMGRDAFEKSLREYYLDYAFMVSTPGEMMKIFERNSADPGSVEALHRHWIVEVHPHEDAGTEIPGLDDIDELLEELLPEDGEFDLGPFEDMLRRFFEDERANPDGRVPIPRTGPSPVI